jgi:hypothetical protein
MTQRAGIADVTMAGRQWLRATVPRIARIPLQDAGGLAVCVARTASVSESTSCRRTS